MAESRWEGKSGLVIALSPASVAAVRALAIYPDLRGDHVTLAYGVARDAFDLAWVPGGHPIGATVPLLATGECRNARVQALLIEAAGSTCRPWDGARLHVTVSKRPDARSSESNALIDATTAPEPLRLLLEGVIAWEG
jgi:hypothetical protein